MIDVVVEGDQLENNRGAGLAVSRGDTVDDNTISGNAVPLVAQGGLVLELGDNTIVHNTIVDNTSDAVRETVGILYAVTDIPLPLSIPDEQLED